MYTLNEAVYDSDCYCNRNSCKCDGSHQETPRHLAEIDEPYLISAQESCYCNDPRIQRRISTEIEEHLVETFRSPVKVRRIFGKKIACARRLVRVRTKVSLACHPNHYV